MTTGPNHEALVKEAMFGVSRLVGGMAKKLVNKPINTIMNLEMARGAKSGADDMLGLTRQSRNLGSGTAAVANM